MMTFVVVHERIEGIIQPEKVYFLKSGGTHRQTECGGKAVHLEKEPEHRK